MRWFCRSERKRSMPLTLPTPVPGTVAVMVTGLPGRSLPSTRLWA